MPFPAPRRLLAACLAAPIAVLGLVFAGLAVLPVLWGHEVGAGFASVEASLCVLGRDRATSLVIGGDSRAKALLDPLILDSIAGRRAINVAENVNLGGDLPTLVNALRKQRGILEGEPVFLISVSVFGHNDLEFGGMTAAGILAWAPWDHVRAAWRKPSNYFAFLGSWYLPFLKRHLRHARQGTGFTCTDEVGLPRALAEARGFRPDTMVGSPEGAARRRKAPPTESDFLLDGGRARAFTEALAWLAASPAQAIVLYNAPILPGWGSRPGEEIDLRMEEEFSALVARAASVHPKVSFLDFVKDPPPELRPEHFADNYHLNDKGAALFSRRIGEHLVAAGLGVSRGEESP